MTTLFALSGVGVPPYSARGLVQTFQPINQATSLRRTINGELLDLADSDFRKYSTKVTGKDQQPPAVEGVWPGLTVQVDCLFELCKVSGTDEETEYTDGTEQTFERPFVPGSIRHESGFTFYRPRLTCRITDFQVTKDEYGAAVDWSMDLEEI